LCDLILQHQQVGPCHVVMLAPHRRSILGPHKLNADAEPITRFLQYPSQDVIAHERSAGVLWIDGLVLVPQDRAGGARYQPLNPCQPGDDRIGNANAQKPGWLRHGERVKRKHGDRDLSRGRDLSGTEPRHERDDASQDSDARRDGRHSTWSTQVTGPNRPADVLQRPTEIGCRGEPCASIFGQRAQDGVLERLGQVGIDEPRLRWSLIEMALTSSALRAPGNSGRPVASSYKTAPAA